MKRHDCRALKSERARLKALIAKEQLLKRKLLVILLKLIERRFGVSR